MQVTLEGRRALVTGSTRSTSGMGYAIAKRLAEAGASVVVNGRTRERVDEAVERIRTDVPEADVSGAAADLTAGSEIERLLAAVPEVDVLVHNAGNPEVKPFFDIADTDWERHFALHVLGAVRLCRHYAQGMVARAWGRILFNAGTTAGFMSGEMVHYGATKMAVLGLSRGLAESMPKSGVTVNAFLPGPTRERTENALRGKVGQPAGKRVEEMEGEIFDALPTSLIRRFIEPYEIADAVLFLASDHGAAITGATLRVDGGIVRFPI
jgi:NAD(P)-dependent dehydrogenase (short-subunit alcohol dehydrogenase family)